MKPERKVRILMAKPGLDGHDRGVKVVARAYRDAGFEVIYTGVHQTPEQIVNTAVQEDIDIIGLSCLSGAHLHLSREVLRLAKEKGIGNVPVLLGGIVPEEDIPKLEEIGIRKVFSPGTPLDEIVTLTRKNIKADS